MFRYSVKYILLSLISFFLIVSPIQAAQLSSGDNIVLPKDSIVEDNYFAAGETVTISGTINGDLYVAGGTVNVEGTVTGDVFAAGGTVNIRGTVGEDVRVAGGQIVISGNIEDDITVMGGSVTVTDEAVVGDSVVGVGGNISLFAPISGSVTVAAGNMEIGSSIEGDVVAGAENIKLTPNGSIQGNLTYYSKNEADIPEGATIAGQIKRQEPPQYKEKMEKDAAVAKQAAKGAGTGLKILNLLSAFLIGFLGLHFFPKYVQSVTNRITISSWQSIGLGFITLLFTPIVIILLFVSVIGMPLGFLTLFAYLFSVYLAKIFVSLVLGKVLLNYFKKEYSSVAVLTIGLVLYLLLSSIPIIGWFVTFVTVTIGIGGMLLGKKDYYSEIKSKKLI